MVDEAKRLTFAEGIIYEESDPQDKEVGKEYLFLWKKYVLRKMKHEFKSFELTDEILIDRPSGKMEEYFLPAQMGLKLEFKIGES